MDYLYDYPILRYMGGSDCDLKERMEAVRSFYNLAQYGAAGYRSREEIIRLILNKNENGTKAIFMPVGHSIPMRRAFVISLPINHKCLYSASTAMFH